MTQQTLREGNRSPSKKLVRCVLPVVIASFGGSRFANAAPAQWDGNSTVGNPGDGVNWSNANNWTTGGVADTAPSNVSPGDDLTFGGGIVGTISLGGNRFANSLNFTAGFTLDPLPSTDTLTLNTATVTVSSGVSAAINAIISSAKGLTLNGAGTLALGNTNPLSGATTVNGGTLVADGATALGSTNLTVGSVGSIVFNANQSFNVVTNNNGSFLISAGDTVSMTSFSASFLQNAGQLTVNGTLNIAGSPFDYLGGNITGTVTMGSTSFAPTLELAAGAGNSGTFALGGEGELLSPGGTATLNVQSNQSLLFTPSTSTATLSSAQLIANAGSITITGSNTSKAILMDGSSTTTVTSSIVNTGTITTSISSTPSSTADFIVGNIFNTSGTLNFNASTQVNGSIKTGGAVNIAAGQVVTFASTSDSIEIDSGSITINGSLNMSGSSFDYDGGNISGTVSIGNASVLPNLAILTGSGTSGTFLITGEGVLLTGDTGGSTPIHSGVTLTLQPATAGQIEATQSISNGGAINIIGSSSSTATLNNFSNTITGTITTSVSSTPSSISDFIVTGLLSNTTGTVNINASTQITGSISNGGTFNIATGQALTFGSMSNSFTQTGGTLAVNGTLSMPDNNFNYTGGSVTGTVNLGATSESPTLTISQAAGNSGSFVFGGVGGTVGVIIPNGATVAFQPTLNGTLNFMAGTVNQGNLNVTDSAMATATLIGNPTITNSGVITTSGAGSLTIASTLVSGILANSSGGTLNVNASLEMLNNPIANNGTINIASGEAILLGTASAEFKQSGGQINVAAGGLLDTRPSTIFLTNGTITLDAGSTSQGVWKPSFVEYSGSTTTATVQSGTVGAGQSPGVVDLSGAQVDFAIGSGTQPQQLIVTAPIKDGALEKSGSGVMEISGANTYAGGTTVTNGTLLVGAANAIPTTNGITIQTGGIVKLATGIGGPTTTFLSIDSTSQLNITNNHLFINYAGAADPITTVAGYLATGYAGGAWTGDGIMSSTVAAGYGIGYADSADTGNPAGLASKTIEIKYTLLGDADLSGVVDGTDFGIVAANFNKGVSRWDQGDFNYDNVVDGTDFGDLAANFNKGASGASIGAPAYDDPAIVAFAEAHGLMADLTNIPEPASSAISLLAAAGILSARRRRSAID